MSAVWAHMCPLAPCRTLTHHMPRGRRTMGACPLSLVPKPGHIPRIWGGDGCSTGPHVPSNPMQDPYTSRSKDMTNNRSAPLVIGPLAGTYSIHSR